MKSPRQILLDKAKKYRQEQDEAEEILYANRKDELERLRRARRDEKIIASMRKELRGKK